MFSSFASYLFGSTSDTSIADADDHPFVNKEGSDDEDSNCAEGSVNGEGETSGTDSDDSETPEKPTGWEMINGEDGDNSQPSPVDPFENRLIEHPSMSVYQQRGKASSTGADDSDECSSDGDDDADMVDEPVAKVGNKRKAVPATRPESREVTARQQVNATKRITKSSQTVKKLKEGKSLNKGQMKRSNNVAQKRSNKPLRRKCQILLRSNGAVYDRKSQ